MNVIIAMHDGELHLTLDELGGQLPRVGDIIDGTFDDGVRWTAEVDQVVWTIPKGEGTASVWISTTTGMSGEAWDDYV